MPPDQAAALMRPSGIRAARAASLSAVTHHRAHAAVMPRLGAAARLLAAAYDHAGASQVGRAVRTRVATRQSAGTLPLCSDGAGLH